MPVGCAEGATTIQGTQRFGVPSSNRARSTSVRQDPTAKAQWPTRLRISALFAGQGDASTLRTRMRTVFFPPPTRWRRPNSEGAECRRRKPGRCWWGSCGPRPGSSGPRLARCCSRQALLGTGEEGAHGVAFPGPRCSLCTPPWARVRWPLCPLLYHSPLSGPGAAAAAKAVSRRRGSARASVFLAAGRASGR